MNAESAAPGASEPVPVTVSMPVYNGSRFVASAISSVLNQSAPPSSFRLFDNASTDNTVQVAESMLPPGSVIRSDHNIGAAANFRRAFEGVTTPYFMWLAADDELDPEFLARTVARLEAHPKAPACLTAVEFIDVEGRPIGVHLDLPLASKDPRERLRCLLRHRRWVEFYCLYRTDALVDAPYARPAHGTDIFLTWWFTLRGPLEVLPEPLLKYRVIEKTVTESDASIHGERAPVTHWRKMRLWRVLWRMAAEPGVERSTRRTARRELLLVLADLAWWHHLAEDFILRWPRFGRRVLGTTAALRARRQRS